jgi:hypothetical protein
LSGSMACWLQPKLDLLPLIMSSRPSLPWADRISQVSTNNLIHAIHTLNNFSRSI